MAYNFKNGPLDQLIDQLIGSSREAKAWENVRKNVPLVLLNHDHACTGLTFEHNGIYSMKDGVPLRVYLYLRQYDVKNYQYPRKHYFRCQTVETYTNFSSTNQETVNIRCTSTDQIYTDLKLPVCDHCQQIFKNQTTQTLLGTSFNDFILQMACNGNNLMQQDKHGYPLNFSEISTAFRASKEYTCENCHLKITEYAHKHYMHTHHINYQKQENCQDNLKCLCIRCHSEVDPIHQNNFKNTPHMARELEKFNALYSWHFAQCF